MPGNEDVVGDPPMCVDALGMQWFKDLLEGKPQPTNSAPGLCYMLCGATQHSNTDAHDKTSPAIPIGPHWMILWPFDANHCGLPTTVRDAGAWIMFAGTPYAYLHVCGTPWAGDEYLPGDEAVWTDALSEKDRRLRPRDALMRRTKRLCSADEPRPSPRNLRHASARTRQSSSTLRSPGRVEHRNRQRQAR